MTATRARQATCRNMKAGRIVQEWVEAFGPEEGPSRLRGSEAVILRCNYEELRALKEGARIVLERGGGESAAVAAPPAERTRVQRLVPRLEGDLTIRTLTDQRRVAEALEMIVEVLRSEMESSVVSSHPGGEAAIAAYFEFGHALSVLGRAREMGEEMHALIELVTGETPTDEVARSFVFPD